MRAGPARQAPLSPAQCRRRSRAPRSASGMLSKVSGWLRLWVPMVWPSRWMRRDEFGIALRHLSHKEIGRLHAFGRKQIENPVGVRPERSVVEGEHHLAIRQRQRLAILLGAQPRMRRIIDHQRAAGSQGIWFCAFTRQRGRETVTQNANAYTMAAIRRISLNPPAMDVGKLPRAPKSPKLQTSTLTAR